MRKLVILTGLAAATFAYAQTAIADRVTPWEQLAREQREARAALDKAFSDWVSTEPDLEQRLLTGDPQTLQRAVQNARNARHNVNAAKITYYRTTQRQLQASLDALKKVTVKPEDVGAATKELDTQESDLRARRAALQNDLDALKKKTTDRGSEDTQSRLIRMALENELANLKELSLNITDQKDQLTQIKQHEANSVTQRDRFLNSYQASIDSLGKTAETLQRSFGAWDRFYDAEARIVADRARNGAGSRSGSAKAPDNGRTPAPSNSRRDDRPPAASAPSPAPPPTTSPAPPPTPAPPPAGTPAGQPTATSERTNSPSPAASQPRTYTGFYDGTWRLDPNDELAREVRTLDLELREQGGALKGSLHLVYQPAGRPPIDLELPVSGSAQPRETLIQSTSNAMKAVFLLRPPTRIDGITMEVELRQIGRQDIKPFNLVVKRH
jgi:hypothetical protein